MHNSNISKILGKCSRIWYPYGLRFVLPIVIRIKRFVFTFYDGEGANFIFYTLVQKITSLCLNIGTDLRRYITISSVRTVHEIKLKF